MPPADLDRCRAAMIASYQAVRSDVERLGEPDLAGPSACLGWNRGDLLFHMLLDAQRALVTFATPAAEAPDTDFVSYWTPFRPGGEGYDAHARFVRGCAVAHQSYLAVAERWTVTAGAATRAAAGLTAGAALATQGHVLTAGDFLATLTVEATIHHLDLLAGDPSPAGLAVTRDTLDGLLGQPVPAAWDDAAYARLATGRAQLPHADRDRLGPLADRFPLLG